MNNGYVHCCWSARTNVNHQNAMVQISIVADHNSCTQEIVTSPPQMDDPYDVCQKRRHRQSDLDGYEYSQVFENHALIMRYSWSNSTRIGKFERLLLAEAV